jgi:Amt family ammonium transporter
MYDHCLNGELNSGDVSMMVMATTFVMLQTPAMGIAQAGLIRRKNALSMIMQVLFGLVIGSLLWFIAGFSLTFGPSLGGVIGSPEWSMLIAIDVNDCMPNGMAPTIPVSIFFGTITESLPSRSPTRHDEPLHARVYTRLPDLRGTHHLPPPPTSTLSSVRSLLLASITAEALMVPVIVSGAWAEKLRFSAFIVFVVVWPFLVYYPLAHWIWNPNGWMAQLGVLDFAGGLTIHTSSGVAALVVSACMQRRKTMAHTQLAHHNIPLAVLGAALIWGGWYSFNGGSAFAATAQAGYAIVNTHIAACGGGMVWVVFTRLRANHWALMEVVNGALAGLATVTPASGFVEPWAALVIGLIGGVISYWTVILFKDVLRLDDVLDVSSLQGVPGLVGSFLLGIFANPALTVSEKQVGVLYAGWESFAGVRFMALQAFGCAVAAAWSALMTMLLIIIMKWTMKIDVSPHVEEVGLDITQIGEQAYDERLALLDDVGIDGATKRLLVAAAQGNVHSVRAIINGGVPVDVVDYDGRSALHLAASEGRVRMCSFLLNASDDPVQLMAIEDRFGRTPLEDAVVGKQHEVVVMLRGMGATMRSTEELGYVLLHSASTGEVREVRRLLESGVDATWADYDARSALHLGAVEGHVEVVRALLNAGALVTAIDRWGHTPLDDALSFGHEDVVNALDPTGEAYNLLVIDRERMLSDKSRDPITVLISPASDGASHPSFPQPVVECGGAATERSTLLLPNSPSTSIQSADYAALHSTDIQLSPGSDIESAQGEAGVAELCDAAGSSNLREVNRLLTKGADVNGKDYDHRTVLHIAACTGDLAVLQRILDVPNVNVNCIDRWHTTPLKDALSNDFIEGAQLLKAHGAISIDEHVGPQLCAAASTGNMQALVKFKLQGVDLSTGDCASVSHCRKYERSSRFLLLGRANSAAVHAAVEACSPADLHTAPHLAPHNASRRSIMFPVHPTLSPHWSDDSRTALSLAASEGQTSIVQWLLAQGISPECTDRYGYTPLDDARRGGHTEVVAILEGR